MKKFWFSFIAFIFAAVSSLSVAAVDLHKAPDVLITEVTNDVLKQIKDHPELQAQDSSAINKLVDENILPYVDFQRMTRMAVGPQWRNATSEQKQEIQSLFRQLLIAVYSGALKEAADYKLEMARNNFETNDRLVIVRTKLSASQRDPIQLDYRLLKNKDGSWKIFDVNVGGVWLVENYRSQFASVISNGGLNNLIKQLRDRTSKGSK